MLDAALDQGARARLQRAQRGQPGAVLVAQWQVKQQVSDRVDAKALQALFQLRADAPQLGEGFAFSRITSYNVCYTKLLRTELYRGAEYVVDFLPKLKLEIAVADERAEEVVEAIAESAASGRIGDGKIFVQDLEQAVRIRTGEQGDEAL